MKCLLSAWLGAFLLFFCTAHGNIENTDASATMHAARALLLRGDSNLRRSDQGAEWLGEAVLADHVELQRKEGVAFYGKQGTNGLTYVWFPMGHVWLMVPAVAVGEALHRAFPEVEVRYRNTVAPGVPEHALAQNLSYRDGHFVFDNAVVAMLPALFGATSLLLLFLLARALGAGPRDSLVSTSAIGLATQFFPLTQESLSDGPGLCALLAALLVTVRAFSGTASRGLLLCGGFAAGFAVLSRYPHGTLVPLLGLVVVQAAWQRRRIADAAWFAIGGLPCLLLLLGINYSRFGDMFDTGYPRAASWFNYPVWFGATKILFAAGKGILWFSPMLWLAMPLFVKHGSRVRFRWLALGLFVVPMWMFSSTPGWQSGQCWGVRYVTPGIVCLLAIVLPQLRPWQTHRRWFLFLFTVGLLVNITGVITPTRGHNQLAGQAVRAMYEREHATGLISDTDLASVHDDAADHFFFEPRFSPLHANWTYAYRSFSGKFENELGQPQHGSRNTIEPLFGIIANKADQGDAPGYWEDRGGRHLWWVFWGSLLGIWPPLLVLPVLLAGLVLSWFGWSRCLRSAA